MRTGKYVIGIPGSPRVKRFFEKNACTEGFNLVPAVDGRSLPWRLVKEAFSPTFVEHQLKTRGEPWLHGTLGCFLSHVKAMEQASRDECDFAIIAEDDAVFRMSPDVYSGLASSQGYDVVYLNDRMQPGKRVIGEREPVGICRLTAANLKGTGTEGYVLSRHAVKALLDQFASGIHAGMPCGYDGFLQSAALVKGDIVDKPGGKSLLRWLEYRAGNLVVGVAVPTIVAHQDGGQSLICC